MAEQENLRGRLGTNSGKVLDCTKKWESNTVTVIEGLITTAI